MNYDLEERTAKFSERILEFVKSVNKIELYSSLFTQLIRSATSIGANYYEANQASSKKDFLNKIFISKKEAGETKYWLRLIAKSFPEKSDNCRTLWKEAHELNLIFAKIISSSKKANL